MYNLDSDLLLGRPRIRLVKDGAAQQAAIRSARRVPGAILLRLDSVNDRDAAEALRGARIEVPREALEPVADGEYYHCDLEGCEVRAGGERIGVVARVVSYPTCDSLVVARAAGEIEVPLTDAYVAAVDLTARTIELSSLPDSLPE